jgi:SEC-C motif-containing protein
MNCDCGSGKKFTDCCQPFLDGTAKPKTAEELMRSRYSAYLTVNIEYLRRTTHPSTRKFFAPEAVKEWAESSVWQKLEVISTAQGKEKDKIGEVEFKAYYLDSNGNPQIHHEHSNFVKELGKWFFVDGKLSKSILSNTSS